jgi:predicted nucleotidyltransferase
LELPLDALRQIASEPIEADGSSPLFVTVSGAHLYGFASPDSDFDLRGAHVMPLRRVLSLFAKRETLEYSGARDGRDIDLVSHEAGKFFRMMLRRNGYVLEQVFSPLVVVGGPLLDELRAIARGCFTRHLHHHYRGFFENQLRLLAKETPKRVKTLLYALLTAGEVEANLPRLLALHPLDDCVGDLIARKAREASALDERELAVHDAILGSLRARLAAAYEVSPLPAEPARARDLDGLLARLRLGEGSSTPDRPGAAG